MIAGGVLLLVGICAVVVVLVGGNLLKDKGISALTLFQATPTLTPTIPPTVAIPTRTMAPTRAVPPAAPVDGAPVHVADLPDLVLVPADLPIGWSNDRMSSSGLDNEAYVNEHSGPAEDLNDLNEWGRITDLTYLYQAPGDPCEKFDSPILVQLDLVLFKDDVGAVQFLNNWGNTSGDSIPSVGDQAFSVVIHQTVNFPNCDTKYSAYYINFVQDNIYSSITMEALDGAISDEDAKARVIDMAKIVDDRIAVASQD